MNHPSIVQQITFLYTRDLAASGRFYEEQLGLALWRDQGTCRIYATVGETALIGLCQVGPASKGAIAEGVQRNVIFTLVTSEVDRWHERLSAQGIVFEKAPAINPTYNIYHCFLRDPNGYLIEIQQFLD
jgi:catechol 2,3-dioxygenase-like lactoylglutathione lyase family enzyme